MNEQKEIKLSSNWTNLGLYAGAILCIAMLPIIFLILTEQKFHVGMIIGPLVFIALIGFIIYQFIYVCDARVVDDKLILKKQFRPAKSYSFDRIGYPTSFRLKNTKYVTVEMKNDDNSLEKYMIVNSRALLSFEKKDAEEALLNLRRIPKEKA